MRELGTEVAVDRPEVVAEVREAFHRYERALVDGDLGVLTELFWPDPRTVRYGVADRQHGAAEIAAWRAAHPSVPPGRRLWGTTVLTVDDRTAVVSTLFGYPDGCVLPAPPASPAAVPRVLPAPPASPAAVPRVEGRQTQVWVRFAQGWRIVAAHVSEVADQGASVTS